MSNIFDVLDLIGYLLRALGSLVFGLGVGWLVVMVFKWEGKSWQLAVAAVLGLLAAFVLLGHYVAGGATIGAFGLGAGAALLAWGAMGLGSRNVEVKGKGK